MPSTVGAGKLQDRDETQAVKVAVILVVTGLVYLVTSLVVCLD